MYTSIHSLGFLLKYYKQVSEFYLSQNQTQIRHIIEGNLMIRYLDTFIRYFWLWLVPLVVFPVIISLLLVSSTTYTAKAALWVDQPIFGDQTSQLNQFDSPAKQMASLLSELLNTREFINSVIGSTSRKQTIKTPQDQSSAIDYIGTKTKIVGDTTRLIRVSFPDSNSNVAVETLQAIIDRFQDYYNGRVKTQGDGAAVYYQQILDASKNDLDKATNDVKQFIEDHPNQVGTNWALHASNPEELEYSRLNQNLDNARKGYNTAKANLERVLTSYEAYLQGQSTTIKVLDKPAILEVGSTQTRQIAIGVGVGIVVGLIFAIIGTIILTLLDPVMRYSFHAHQILVHEQVIELPNYGLKSKIKNQSISDTEYDLDKFVKTNKIHPSGKKLFRRKINNFSLRRILTVRFKQSANE